MSTEFTKVLLVEDSLGDARLIFEGLTEAFPDQFEITHVRRLSEALEWLWEESCDVVLLDLGLPDSHGLATINLLRAQAPAVPLVVLTGFQDEATAVEALKEGAQDYLVKGAVDSKLLARSMRGAIARKEAEEAVTRQAVALTKAEELQRSRQRIIAAQEAVCQEIAARLQTGVGQRLLALMARLQEAVKGIRSSSETARPIEDVVAGLDEVVKQHLALLSLRLYPSSLEHGLVPALLSLRTHLEKAAGVEIEMVVDEELVRRERADPNLVPRQVKLAVYRIASEALIPAAEGVQAWRATLTVRLQPDGRLELAVRRSSLGREEGDLHAGAGMEAMRDYAEAMGGWCAINGASGQGMEVAATFPLGESVAGPPT